MIEQVLNGNVGDAAVAQHTAPRLDAEIIINLRAGGYFTRRHEFENGRRCQHLRHAGETEQVVWVDDLGEIIIPPAVALTKYQLAVLHQSQRAGLKIVGDQKIGHGRFQRCELRHDRTAAGAADRHADTLKIQNAAAVGRVGRLVIGEGG